MSNLITISYGDTAKGPKLLEAALAVLADAGAALEIETVQLGKEMVKLGYAQGFNENVLRTIGRSRVLLTAPISNGVISKLQSVLSDDCKIFIPAKATKKAMLKAAIEMLRYHGQNEVADKIAKGKY